ncbi:MAG: ABC transporter ATP-binding protein/permease, partial [Phascolarctobacterium sp.]|nr:ABC transporter ATP-binding protein/permease [Candidatus Phascolarctobacterium equi]
MNSKFIFSRAFFGDAWRLTKAYFTSEEKKRAWGLLAAIIALTLGIVYMLVQLNQWYNVFYSALQDYNAKKIYDELLHFSWLAAIYIILSVYAYYLRQKLILHWRKWLTVRFIDE